MSQVEVQLKTSNLSATAAHFLTLPLAQRPPNREGAIASLGEAETFLIDQIEIALGNVDAISEIRQGLTVEVVRPVRMIGLVSVDPAYSPNGDLVSTLGTSGRMFSRGALERGDNGHYRYLSMTAPYEQSNSLLIEIELLTKLDEGPPILRVE